MKHATKDRAKVVVTHLPTGTVARSNAWARNQKERTRLQTEWATALLRAKLCAPPSTPIRRTYDLCPPLEIPPHIRNGVYSDGLLADGTEAVQRFLDGRWE